MSDASKEKAKLIEQWVRGELTDDEFRRQIDELDYILGNIAVSKKFEEVHDGRG